jgi:arylsulfatase A-like enzyme
MPFAKVYRVVLLVLGCAFLHNAHADAPRPNIVFVLMDDQRWDDLGYAGHPFVKTPNIDRIAHEGVQFKNAFVTTPLCSPSRASFLTGQYAHTHGVTDNTARDKLSHQLVTWPRLLHDVGYETGFVGKWHMGLDDTKRPGFDYWVSIRGQGQYLDPQININGSRTVVKGYVTDIFADYAIDFLKQKHDKPFLLWVAHKAVHPDLQQAADGTLSDPSAGKFIPAERHKYLYSGKVIKRRPNFGIAPDDKPALARKIDSLPPLSDRTGTDDETVRNRLSMVTAVDESVGRMIKVLEDAKQLDNTLFIFTSDEGYFYGEHGLSVERRLAYEESAKIPLVMRYPKMIKPGSVRNEMVLNIDIAPTMLELGGAKIPDNVQGKSFVPLIESKTVPWRDSFLIEYWSDKVFPRVLKMGYKCVRTDRWKYIHYVDLNGMDELYDLKKDPYELTNVVSSAEAKQVLPELKVEMVRLSR